MVGVLPDQHVGDQPEPGQAGLEWLGGDGGDHHLPLARPAGVLGPGVDHDLEPGRHELQDLAPLVADARLGGAAHRADLLLGGRLQNDLLARQVGGQRPAAGLSRRRLVQPRQRRRQGGLRRRLAGLGPERLFEEQPQLVGGDLLGAAPEPIAEQAGEARLQPVVVVLELLQERQHQVEERVVLPVLQQADQVGPDAVDVVGRGGGGGVHRTRFVAPVRGTIKRN